MAPTITVITICKNAEMYIEGTIKSVLSQNYSYKEYIIIDGNSLDNTMAIINKYRESIDCIVSEPDKGISDAFNKGILRAKGELIGILNAGDYYIDENVLDKVADEYVSEYGIIQGMQVMKNYDTGFEYIFKPSTKYGHILSLVRFHPNHMSTFVNKNVYKNVGLYNLNYLVCMDIEFLYRCHRANVKVKTVDQNFVVFRHGGISENNDWRSYKEKNMIIKSDNGTLVELLICSIIIITKNIVKIVARHTIGMDFLRRCFYK
jgi:glycosyltransferase involved in cell wall biosynthesis